MDVKPVGGCRSCSACVFGDMSLAQLVPSQVPVHAGIWAMTGHGLCSPTLLTFSLCAGPRQFGVGLGVLLRGICLTPIRC